KSQINRMGTFSRECEWGHFKRVLTPSAMFSWRISLTALADKTSLNTGTIEAVGKISRGGIEEINWHGHGRVGVNGQPNYQVRGRIDGGGSKTVGAAQLQPDPAIRGLHAEQRN